MNEILQMIPLLDDEKDHMAWEAQYLYLIDKIGYENFLMAMM